MSPTIRIDDFSVIGSAGAHLAEIRHTCRSTSDPMKRNVDRVSRGAVGRVRDPRHWRGPGAGAGRRPVPAR